MKKKRTAKTVKKTIAAKTGISKAAAKRKSSFEERLLSLADDDDFILPLMNENMREKLLKEEFKLRKKQPTAWTKTKYRKYAMINRPKKEKARASIEEENDE
ncbi:MAG: hypothetical protein J4215_04470 [Candidatus Diapherotrites archaeon]|uniref:Uncharacterized protein n=1 Tax=Candidatus Iainarchaeum sp. TaxID=3101447 RepID=A0A8T4L3A5_9ARCH|nr:hypothetical protein [Candidatus Diapherotrites archaeon]